MVWNRGQGWRIWRSVYTLYSLEGSIWMPRGHMMADVFWMQFACVSVCVYTCSQTFAVVSDVLYVHIIVCVCVQCAFMDHTELPSPPLASVHNKCRLLLCCCWENNPLNISQAPLSEWHKTPLEQERTCLLYNCYLAFLVEKGTEPFSWS